MNLTSQFSRVAIEIQEKGPDTNWFNIGHGKDYGDRPYAKAQDRTAYAWIWNRGTLEVSEALSTKGRRNHGTEFPEFNWSGTYYGRYDPVQELISIVVPYNRSFRPVPEVIKSSLEQQFPNAKKIVVFVDNQ